MIRAMGGRVCRVAARRNVRRLAVAAGVLVMVLALGYSALSWRLWHGPISLAFLNDRIVAAVAAELPPGLGLEISDTVLERDDQAGGVRIGLKEVAVVDDEGTSFFAAPRAGVTLSSPRLLVGGLAPRSLWLIEPRVTLVETEDGLRPDLPEEVLDFGHTHTEWIAVGMAGALGLFRQIEGLAAVGVRNGAIEVQDRDGRAGELRDVSFSLGRGEEQGSVHFDAGIGDLPGMPRAAGLIRRDDAGDLVASLRLRDLAAGDLGPLAPRGLEDVFNGPVSSDIAARVASDGKLGAVGGQIRIGAGFIGSGERRLLVDEADFGFEWSRGSGKVTIRPSTILAGHHSATLSGEITVPEPGEFRYGTVPIHLELSDVRLGDPVGGTGTVYPSVSLDALYVRERGVMHVNRLDVAAPDAAMSFIGSIGGTQGAASPAVQLAGSMLPVPYEALKELWPPFLAPETRNWVFEHLSAGRITEATLDVEIPPGALAAALRGVPLPDTAYQLEFGLEDVNFGYLGEMPPVVGARGDARLTPKLFDLRMEAGSRVMLENGDEVAVGDGRFLIEDRRTSPMTGEVTLGLAGSASAMLRLFDYPPLEIASRHGVDPDNFAGVAELDMGIGIPLVRDVRFPDVDLTIDGRVEEFAAQNFHGARTVSDGSVSISVGDGRLAIEGKGLLDGVPAEIAIDEPLDGEFVPGSQTLALTLDEAARERLGIRLGGMLSGPVRATISEIGAQGTETIQKIEADLAAARIDLPYLGLDKPAGEPATAIFLLAQDENTVRLGDIVFESNAIRIAGDAEFTKDGEIVDLNLPVVRTARGTDVTLTGARENGVTVLDVTGEAIDLRAGLSRATGVGLGESQASGAAPMRIGPAEDTTRINVDVGTVLGSHGEELADVEARVERAGGEIVGIELDGRTATGAPVYLRYSGNGSNVAVRAETEDAGSLLAWSGLYSNMRSGRLDLAARSNGGPLSGRLVINGFSISNDPSLTRLIARGEEDVGTVASRATEEGRRNVNPANVGFDTLVVPFTGTGRGLRISEGVLRGPAVGATLEGEIDFSDSRVDLSGTYVPVYEINNLFGQLPLVGPLLGGRRNEGLLGITYSVSGSLEQPALTVNPLSVVAPGVFRYILGMDNPSAYRAGSAGRQ